MLELRRIEMQRSPFKETVKRSFNQEAGMAIDSMIMTLPRLLSL